MNFRRRFSLVLFGVTAATGCLLLWLSSSLWQKQVQKGTEERLLMVARGVASHLDQRGSLADGELRELVLKLGGLAGARITLVGEDGRVLADSQVPGSHLGFLPPYLGRKEIAGALARGQAFDRRPSAITRIPTLYAAVRTKAGGRLLVVRTATEFKAWQWPWMVVLGVFVTALAIAGLSAQLVANYHAQAAQHLIPWCELPPTAEMPALAYEADRRFREIRDQLARELEVCQQALGQVSEGVVLLDASQVIRFANRASQQLLGALSLGAYLWEEVRDPQVLGLIQGEHRISNSRYREVQINGHTLAVYAVPLDHPLLAYALILRDIGSERRFEAARRAFIADLAHELRTPIAVMRGALEELETEGVKSEAVGILLRQIHRLIRLAQDLEELVRIESGALQLNPELFDLSTLAAEVAKDLGAFARKREVTVTVIGASTQVFSDRLRVSQVLTNLVDNAIRYNKPGGAVEVRIGSHGESVTIHVKDTGLGIAKSNLDLVFQRFYRVHRGKEEGSGLGLAIVKHLVQQLGGRVALNSVVGQGTEITVTLPQKLSTDEPPPSLEP